MSADDMARLHALADRDDAKYRAELLRRFGTTSKGSASSGWDGADIYRVGYWICGVLIFASCWLYCIGAYGFLLGVGLGWLPSAILATVASFVWPLLLTALGALIYLLLK